MTHEFDGKKYERASTHQKEWGVKLITELGLKGAESILDLGCGDGTVRLRSLTWYPTARLWASTYPKG